MNFDEFKRKFNNLKKLNSMVQQIKLIKRLASSLLEIYKLFFKEKTEKNMTRYEVHEKISNEQMSSDEKQMLNFLFTAMEKLNVSDVNQLIEKINNWIELLNFIDNSESTNIQALLDEMNNLERQLENGNHRIQKEIMDDIVEPSKYNETWDNE